MLQVTVTSPGLQSFEVLLDDPAGTIVIDDLPDLVGLVDEFTGGEHPSDRLFAVGRVDLSDLDDAHFEGIRDVAR